MDAVIKSALSTWDNFLEKYPDNFVNKTFLQRNISLVRKLIEVVVPNVMRKSIELEDELEMLSGSYDALNAKRIQETVSLAGLIKITVSCIHNMEELQEVLIKFENYGFSFQLQDNNTNLQNPLWMLCASYPNETLSPFILTHAEYSSLVSNNQKVLHVDLDDCALMAESKEVADLLQELELE